MWLSVLLGWVGVRWFGSGMGWVWTGFDLSSALASFPVWSIYAKRIDEWVSTNAGAGTFPWRLRPSIIELTAHHHP
jgi:hypothetical protein